MKKYIMFLCFIYIIRVMLVSCSDPAIGDIYGEALIYMPQATHNLGTDCNLNLNLSVAAVTADPSLKTQTTLGIYRSGTQPKETATVDLVINSDTLKIAKVYALGGNAPSTFNIYKTGVLLESRYYDPLPDKLTIKDGERQATTQLILHNSEIFANYSIGQILLLPVQIMNPTRYELKKSLSLTMVVITLGK
jgi:hypothetical protein